MTPKTSNLTRVLQVIVGALAIGCLAFGAVVLVLALGGGIEPRAMDPLPYWLVLCGLALVAVLLPALTEGAFRRRLRELIQQGAAQEAGQQVVSRTVIVAAVTEAFGIAGGTFVLVTADAAFAFAPFVAAARLLLMFPTEARVQQLLRG
jgi:hypothetical protein